MNEANPKSAVELELKRLEKRLEDLIVTVSQIKEENRALRQRQETLTSERAGLLDSAEFLNMKMREIRDSGKVVGLDRIAVIAALNMANELIRFRNRDTNLESDVGGRLRILRERVESALEKGQQLEL